MTEETKRRGRGRKAADQAQGGMFGDDEMGAGAAPKEGETLTTYSVVMFPSLKELLERVAAFRTAAKVPPPEGMRGWSYSAVAREILEEAIPRLEGEMKAFDEFMAARGGKKG